MTKDQMLVLSKACCCESMNLEKSSIYLKFKANMIGASPDTAFCPLPFALCPLPFGLSRLMHIPLAFASLIRRSCRRFWVSEPTPQRQRKATRRYEGPGQKYGEYRAYTLSPRLVRHSPR